MKAQPSTPGSTAEYRHKVFSYLDDEGLALLEALTKQRKLSRAALVRTLIQEEAKREGVTAGQGE